jgi:hypothetical protein
MLYQDISITIARRLVALRNKVTKEGAHLVRNTERMSLHTTEITYKSATKLLFPHLVSLREYFASQIHLDPLVLRTLHSNAWANLSALGIGLAAQHQGRLVVLHQFLALEWLQIKLYGNDAHHDFEADPVGESWSLCLPRLGYFECRVASERHNNSVDVLDFIASCQFPPACTLYLELPGVFEWYPDNIIKLDPLFEKHAGAAFIRLAIAELRSPTKLLDQLHHVILDEVEDLELFMKVQLPRVITFKNVLWNLRTLVEKLAQFRASHKCTPVWMHFGQKWSWASFVPDYHDLQLHVHAKQLYPLGVYIVDEDGLDIEGGRHDYPGPPLEDSTTQKRFGGRI